MNHTLSHTISLKATTDTQLHLIMHMQANSNNEYTDGNLQGYIVDFEECVII